MPETPRISVHAYIDARLDEQDEHTKFLLEQFKNDRRVYDEKIRSEVRKTRAWVFMLTAPSWAAFLQDFTSHEVATTVAVFIFILGGIGVAFFHTRKQVRD